MLISEKINHAFNKQIGHELGNSIQYLAIATHFERESLFGLAKIYYAKADEEREHAMKFVKFLLDAGGRVVIPAISAPRASSSRRWGRAACTRFGDGHNPANLRSGCVDDGREELHRFELPPVVRQRAAQGSVEAPRRGSR